MIIIKLNFKEKRLLKKLSQKQLAIRCNLTQSYISDLENNFKSPTLRTVASIAQALEVHPFELLEIYLM